MLRIGRSGVRISARSRDFIFSETAQTHSGAHPPLYSTGNGHISVGYNGRVMKLTSCYHLNVEVKTRWSYTANPSTSSRRGQGNILIWRFSFVRMANQRRCQYPKTSSSYSLVEGREGTMNRKGCRRKRAWPNLKQHLGAYLDEFRRHAISSVQFVVLENSEIKSAHHQ